MGKGYFMEVEKDKTEDSIEQERVLHMNAGDGINSYAKNSLFQKKVMLKAKPVLQQSISELLSSKNVPDCIKIADMGCSSGPNTFVPIWEIVDAIDETCNRLKTKPPVLQVFLNDLPANDFNLIFRSLPSFYKKLEEEKGGEFGPCFVAAMPGNFYGRLFPPKSLHFVHSSYSIHWLSQVPEGIVTESGISLNKGNIWISETSPPAIHKAYSDQFERDFTLFLRSRSEEIISGGHMVITCMAQTNNPSCKFGSCELLRLIGDCIKAMVDEGIIKESILDSCNIPNYPPSRKEMVNLIEKEDSFMIAKLEEFELSWDTNIEDGHKDLEFNQRQRGEYVATYMRAVTESILANYFENAIIEDLFHRFSIKVANYMDKGIGLHNNLVIFMINK
ncbi:7-methylxanthosine synthase 1-like [Mercurialis annua]|uniref:7-methylxanthosine synthase 1-like n=1 Tax=Mercurialis annua TaxID=3986 RepID=UPI0021607129|nr:7-methylxanthosine synthase 1-like [Mercurialis annua]